MVDPPKVDAIRRQRDVLDDFHTLVTRTKTVGSRCAALSVRYSHWQFTTAIAVIAVCNQEKGNTRARQPFAPRTWQQEQPRPPKR
jgi:hypothetical protein